MQNDDQLPEVENIMEEINTTEKKNKEKLHS